jgi:hypothetical protein
MNKNTLQGQIYHFLRPFRLLTLLVGWPESFGGQIRNVLHTHISAGGMNNMPTADRSSET